MAEPIKIAMIGMDTSHAIEFTRRMQDRECPYQQFVDGMRVVTCLRFVTPFTNEAVLDERQAQLEKWEVKVTTSFDEAVADCDAIMIEINDPSFHLEYVQKCAELGKPVFLDKPLADTLENGKAIVELAKKKTCKIFSASSLRFSPALRKAHATIPYPSSCVVYGPLGAAPAGSSIVWYGVHTFEMLQRAMGRGAKSLFVKKDAAGITAIVEYPGNRRGVVELPEGAWVWGGSLRSKENAFPFVVDMGRAYSDLLVEVGKFFETGKAPVELEDTLEVMAMLDASQRSFDSGKDEAV
jgi:predicted dehydrogenase